MVIAFANHVRLMMKPIARNLLILVCFCGCQNVGSNDNTNSNGGNESGGGNTIIDDSPGDELSGDSSSTSYDPSWSDIAALNTTTLDYDDTMSASENGTALKAAVAGLVPGDHLQIGAGSYDLGTSVFDITVSGTAQAPIVIDGQGQVKMTRPDASQNGLIIGSGSPVSYVALKGIEIEGSSIGIRVYNCSNLWLDSLHIHDTDDAALTTNTTDTEYIYITRNEIHDTNGFGEGMYLGANNGAVIMRYSVVALNHVYNTGGQQGDGIELKQGSYGNLIAENLVHDCNYPCILVYGTDGEEVNIIEKNILYNSNDNVMQVQGEAIVRNNLMINGNTAFHSHDHQGQTTNLQVIHNTIINSGMACRLNSWSGREGMVFANNAVYSESADAIRLSGDGDGVAVSGNVVFGSLVGISSGTVAGQGLADFVNLTFDAAQRDAKPSDSSALLGAADEAHATEDDLEGSPRSAPIDAGSYEHDQLP